MNVRLPMYEGDGFIRQGMSTPSAEVTPTAARSSSPSIDELQGLEREARRLRSEYVFAMLVAIKAWFADIPRRARQDSAERYLAGATDHAEVERRIRVLERSQTMGWNRRIPA